MAIVSEIITGCASMGTGHRVKFRIPYRRWRFSFVVQRGRVPGRLVSVRIARETGRARDGSFRMG